MRAFEFKELINSIKQQRKGIKDEGFILETLRDAMLLALRKRIGIDDAVEVNIDPREFKVKIRIKRIVKKDVLDPIKEISIEKAKEIVGEDVEEGELVWTELEPSELDRSTVYKIMNVFHQRIKEAEKRYIYRDFENRIGDIITGTIQKVDKTGVYVSLGKVEAILPPDEQIKKDRYRQGGEITAMILRVNESKRYPIVILTRTHPDFVKKIVEKEIPEILENTVEIKSVARIPGERSKIAVYSKNPRIDPVGACLGQKGTRLSKLIQDIGERIEVIKWSPDILEFAYNALKPAKPLLLYNEGDKIIAVVKDEDIPQAKGEGGSNVILASKLVGKEILVVGEKEGKRPPKGVSILEIGEKFGKRIEEELRNQGIFVFYEVPPLRKLLDIRGVGEKLAYEILDFIEEKLEERKKGQ